MVLLRKLVNALILFLNLIVSGLFIFSAYSDHISPVSFLYPSYFGILFPFFFVLLLFFLFFWLVRMKWLVLLPILTLLICWEPVTRYCPLHIMPEKEPVESIKFLTYNTCAMGRNAFWNENEGNNVINFIKEQDADIVCLQEYLYYKNKGKLTE